MKLIKQYVTQNPCYKAGETITPKGIMVHSTATPGVMASAWFSRWNKSTEEVAVHAFVDETEVCQHLPWNHRAWHAAGRANNTHIAFEICEPTHWKTNKEYFKKAYENALELAAFLCGQYNIDPMAVISHKEGHARGIASNHGDPEHWFRYFGYSMDTFRADLKKRLKGEKVEVELFPTRPLLQSGDTGTHVVYLQGKLNLMKQRLGLSLVKLNTDGIFGPKTLYAVKDFQVARGLAVDGIVGPATWQALGVSYGDVNADGKVNAKDALQVLRSAVGKETLTEKQKETADLNADGNIDAKDAQKILKQAVGGE